MLEAALSECLLWFGGRFVSPAKLRPEVGCRSVEDSLAVFAGAAGAEGSGIVAVEGALLHRAKDTDGRGDKEGAKGVGAATSVQDNRAAKLGHRAKMI
jgi:hypothetical protein